MHQWTAQWTDKVTQSCVHGTKNLWANGGTDRQTNSITEMVQGGNEDKGEHEKSYFKIEDYMKIEEVCSLS